MKTALRSLAAGLMIASLPAIVQAEPQQQQIPCDQRNKIVNVLAHQFSEQQVGSGLTPGGQVLEVFASRKGSWTILLTLPSGRSCMIATGEDWDGHGQLASAPGTPI